jgi:probable rRNA maturation factor
MMMQPARKARTAAPKIDVLIESGLWKSMDDAGAIARRAVTEASALLATPPAVLAIVLTDDSAIRQLNHAWRGVAEATNVLSFPTPRAAGPPTLIGDIVLAFETIEREARADDKPLAHHVAHLCVHGYLHLLGYDHVQDADAEAMEQVEREVLQRLDIPDPYRRGQGVMPVEV